MKLYTMAYQDVLNLSKPELTKRLEDALSEEAKYQGWKEGYSFTCTHIYHRNDGVIEYTIEVEGEYESFIG